MPRKVFSSQAYRHKVVLVSGGCSGIGRALALRFARAGARLAILDLDQAALDSLVQHLRDHLGGEALGLRCDVADADAVERAVALAVERFGGIDVLVNNAGITHRGTFAETGLGVFRKVMAVNFFGAVHCTRAAPAPAGAVQRQLAGAAAGALLSASLRKAAGAAPVGTQAATLTALSGRGRGRRSPGSCPSRRPRPCARRGRG